MHNKLQEALSSVKATDAMKRNTLAFVLDGVARRQNRSRWTLRYAIACCVLLLVCSVWGYSFYATPVSFISVDVNPSVELGLNRLDRVVTVQAYNDDGALVLRDVDLKRKSYTEAVELLLANETLGSYLSQGALLSFTVVSEKEEALLAGIQQCKGYVENGGECHSARAELRKDAHHTGLSMGKYQAYLELRRYDPTITPEACNDLSMRQIRDRISQYTNGVDTHAGNGCGNGHHSGRGK